MAATSPNSTATPGAPSATFRGDIDGLRAVSILLVVAFHADVAGFAGGFVGVDVFFVISGYLITRNLVAEAERTGRVRLLGFTANRLRRLVPALALMVATTLLVSLWVMPRVRLGDVGREGAAAALYVSNILFARDAEDYFAGDIDESPFLHTWSLGIEEQFYLLWPMVVLLVCLVVRRHPQRLRTALGVAFSVILVTSMWANVVLSGEGSSWAFYGLHARAWEFAAAGLLAVLGPPPGMRSAGLRLAAAAGGAALVLFATFTLSADTVYPGWWAVVPVTGALLLVASGDPRLGGMSPLARALAVRPMQWVGRVSYSWYLWHWPAIILAIVWVGRDAVDVRVVAALASLPVAAVAHQFVERPLRFSPRLALSTSRSFVLAVVATGVVVAGAVGVARYATWADDDSLQHRLIEAREDRRQHSCTLETTSASGIDHCVDGDIDGDRTVMLVGDSHARHWKTALSAAAEDSGLRLIDRWRGACPVIELRILRDSRTDMEQCEQYRADTWALIAELRPDAVVVAQSNGYRRVAGADGEALDIPGRAEAWSQAFGEALDRLDELGVRQAVVLDNPRYGEDPVECMSVAGSIEPCESRREDLLEATGHYRRVELEVLARRVDVAVLDAFDLVCDDEWCRLEHDGVIAYSDREHLTLGFTMLQRDRLQVLVDDVLS